MLLSPHFLPQASSAALSSGFSTVVKSEKATGPFQVRIGVQCGSVELSEEGAALLAMSSKTPGRPALGNCAYWPAPVSCLLILGCNLY